jgi:protein involved in polysaccharide export with SLBB domain
VFRIYLTGQVRGPGAVLATGSSRIADVLNPGALFDNASTRRIEVLHRDGTREIADLGLLFASGAARLNPWLQDGDVIFVPIATEFIHIQGAVAKPGDYELGPNDSLVTLLRLAGDPIPGAYLDRSLLIRWKSPLVPESLWVNLEDVYAGRDNPVLHEGERLYVYFVPQYHVQHEAAVAGEVLRPGSFPIVEGRTHLSDLIKYADGFLPAADLSSIRVHRRNTSGGERDPELDRLLRLSRGELTNTEYVALQTKLASLREDYRVDWTRLQQDPSHLDPLLRDGDVVRVERLVLSVRVDGEVRRPGILSFNPGLTMRDYVSRAGGFTDRAWVGKARVTRAVNGQVIPATSVKALDPGDFIWIPERPDVTTWQQAQSVLSSLAYIATIVIAIRSVR